MITRRDAIRVATLAQSPAVATEALQSRFYIHTGRAQYKFGRARTNLGRAAGRDLIQNSPPILERDQIDGGPARKTLRSSRDPRSDSAADSGGGKS